MVKKTSISDKKVEKTLINNFVALQKVLTNLSIKLDDLTNQISKLLELFEISAKAMAEKNFETGKTDNKEVVEKLDSLLDQNKTIARGLTLMHERNISSEPDFERKPIFRRSEYRPSRRF